MKHFRVFSAKQQLQNDIRLTQFSISGELTLQGMLPDELSTQHLCYLLFLKSSASIFLWCQAEKPWAPNTNHCQRLAFICWSAGLGCSGLPTHWAAFLLARRWEKMLPDCWIWFAGPDVRLPSDRGTAEVRLLSWPPLFLSLNHHCRAKLFRLQLSNVAFGREQMLTAWYCKTQLWRRFSKLCTLSCMHYEWGCM